MAGRWSGHAVARLLRVSRTSLIGCNQSSVLSVLLDEGISTRRREPEVAIAVAARATTASETLAQRILRGAVGGAIAGGVFIAITSWFSQSLGDPADGPLMMISTIVKGDGAMEAGTASVPLGWVVHAVLSVAFGVAFGVISPWFKTNGTVALAGIAYGSALYVLNFLIISPLAFPIFKMANQPFELIVHVVFGVLLSLAFFGSGVRGREPFLAVRADTLAGVA